MINKIKEMIPRKDHPVWELIRFAVMAVIIVIPLRIFVAQPFIVSGSSMVPTFENGQYLIVDEISYRIQEPKRYDVIVFRYPGDKTKFYIKRIIGLPGETIKLNGEKITIKNTLYPNGFEVSQSFVKNMSNNSEKTTVLPEGEYFVMGDNRPYSSDSRTWGTLPKKLIMGKVLLRLFPFKEIEFMPGVYKVNE